MHVFFYAYDRVVDDAHERVLLDVVGEMVVCVGRVMIVLEHELDHGALGDELELL